MASRLLVFLVGLLVSWGATSLLLRSANRLPLDLPNVRSSHKRPTPRGGGIGIMVGLVCGYLTMRALRLPVMPPEILGGTLLLAIIGLVDDWWNVRVTVRLGAQLVVACIVVVRLGGISKLPLPPPLDPSLGALGGVLGVLWLVGVANIYNFLDGIDGFAGTQGFLAALGLWVMQPNGPIGSLAACIAGACVGFLILNWHPAKVFMGDVGSVPLGFLFAAIPFSQPTSERPVGVLVTALFLWFFLSDGTVTIVRRLVQGHRPWEAHRTHLYQRLTIAGLNHAQVTTGMALATTGLIIVTLVVVKTRSGEWRWIPIAVAASGLLTYIKITQDFERRVMSHLHQ